MYGGRYGIWGVDPYAPDLMSKALQTAQGLGDNQARLLQNQGLGMQNEYYPQNQAINLASAVLGQENLAHQQQRFGPGYVLAKMINTLPSKIRLGLAAENPALYSTAVQMANDDYINGNQPRGPSMGMQILQPFVDRQNGLGQNSQQQFMPQSYGMGQNVQQPQPQVSQQGYGVGQNNVPQNAQQNTIGLPSPMVVSGQPNSIQNTIQKYGQQGIDKELRNVGQQDRLDADTRFSIAMQDINERIPLVMKYTGVLGKGILAKDALMSSMGITSPSYKAYEELKPLMEAAKGDLSKVLGKRSTDAAAKEVAKVLDYDSFFSNPEISESKWNSAMNVLQNTMEANKRTTSEQVHSKNKSVVPGKGGEKSVSPSSPSAQSKSGWHGDKYTHSGGKSYTLEELQKIASGAKK